MSGATLAELLERIVLAGVGLTTRALAEATPGLDLTFPQWRVLVVLGDSSQGATVSEVAARIGVTVPATSRQLRRLARRGLLEIRPDTHDRRAARATLTTAGRSARERILGFRRRHLAESLSRIQVADRGLRKLAAIADALDNYR
jgi:DNA-binding MarR family transcriptional regulator